MGTEEQTDNGYRGTEEQWVQRNSGYRGTVSTEEQRHRRTGGTEGQWVQRRRGTLVTAEQR